MGLCPETGTRPAHLVYNIKLLAYKIMPYINIMLYGCQYTFPNTHSLVTPTLFDRQSSFYPSLLDEGKVTQGG